jgi:tRNA(Met) cytidine acetyltransferase
MQQRQCLLLQGQPDWLSQQVAALHQLMAPRSAAGFSNTLQAEFIAPLSRAKHQVGKEHDFVVFDASSDIHVDALAVVLGTVVAGGVLLLLLPDTLPSTLWWQRFSSLLRRYCEQFDDFHWLMQNQSAELPKLSLPEPKQAEDFTLTADQQLAHQAILRVVHGHRRRPLVLHADRGRGKSAVLGIAAADLIIAGKQRIIVTAPSKANVETLLWHSQRHLAETADQPLTGRIEFIAPDELIKQQPKTDLLIVDEAAAIPVAMLKQLLAQFSRVVFASTLHGYEGTGTGFMLKFKAELDLLTPGWHQLKLNQPVRWSDDDKLEALSFEALLLNASLSEAEPSAKQAEFALVDKRALLADEATLKQLYALMVLAHYRTRPSDLKLLLDNEAISLAVLRTEQQIIACAWLVEEGPLDPSLAEAVFNGTRRVKGHLLPQSLLAQLALPAAGKLSYQRVVRIAVHPALQSQGLGSQLLTELERAALANNIDVLGTSFAADERLISFWSQAEFYPVRVGHHADEVSGQQALLWLKPLSPQGAELAAESLSRFQRDWALELMTIQSELDTGLANAISRCLPCKNQPVDPADIAVVKAFAMQQRSFENAQMSLLRWAQTQLFSSAFRAAEPASQQLLLAALLQQRSWAQLAQQFSLSGKAEIVKALRLAVASLVSD